MRAKSLKDDPKALAAAMASLSAEPVRPIKPWRGNSNSVTASRKRLARQATKITGLKQVTQHTPIAATQRDLRTAASLKLTKQQRRK